MFSAVQSVEILMVIEEKTERSIGAEGGQATVEYILLLAVVVGFYMAASAGLNRLKLGERIMAPLVGPFSAAYRYGHPKAKGFDDGGPKNHPRAEGGDGNFRIFLNPKVN